MGNRLVKACKTGDLDKVQSLIANGVNINRHHNGGRTALMYACRNGHIPIAVTLIDAGADIRARDEKGGTALHHAALCHRSRLMRRDDKEVYDNREIIRLLLEEGIDINTPNDEGRTALFEACRSGSLTLVKYLLKQKANCETRVNMLYFSTSGGSEKWTPLMVACHNSHYNVVRYLLRYGADKDFTNEVGENALTVTKARVVESRKNRRTLLKIVRVLEHGDPRIDRRRNRSSQRGAGRGAGRGRERKLSAIHESPSNEEVSEEREEEKKLEYMEEKKIKEKSRKGSDSPTDEENEEEEEEHDNECIICLSEQATYVIFPCMHLCLCKECSQRFEEEANRKKKKKKNDGEGAKCPLCRGFVANIVEEHFISDDMPRY